MSCVGPTPQSSAYYSRALMPVCVLSGATWHKLLAIFSRLLLVLGLEVPQWGQDVNPGQLLLVLGLGPFNKVLGLRR